MSQTPIVPIDVEYKQKDWARCKGNALSYQKSVHVKKKETVPRNLCNSNGYAKASKEIRKLLGRERRSTSRLGENNNDLRKEAK